MTTMQSHGSALILPVLLRPSSTAFFHLPRPACATLCLRLLYAALVWRSRLPCTGRKVDKQQADLVQQLPSSWQLARLPFDLNTLTGDGHALTSPIGSTAAQPLLSHRAVGR